MVGKGHQIAVAQHAFIDQLQYGAAEAQLGQGDVGRIVQLGGAERAGAVVPLLGEVVAVDATGVELLHAIGGQQPFLLGPIQQGAERHPPRRAAGHGGQIRQHAGFQGWADRLVIGGGDHFDRLQFR